jgi:hypothetical protein
MASLLERGSGFEGSKRPGGTAGANFRSAPLLRAAGLRTIMEPGVQKIN